MVFKINLAACIVFVLGSIGLCLSGPIPTTFHPSDLVILLFFWSPVLLWAGGAWAFRNRGWPSIVWLLASILLMSAELVALYLEAEKAREEAITHQQTQSILGFLVILLEWAVGLPFLVILASIWRFTRIVDYEE
jgi:hypothetical protein